MAETEFNINDYLNEEDKVEPSVDTVVNGPSKKQNSEFNINEFLNKEDRTSTNNNVKTTAKVERVNPYSSTSARQKLATAIDYGGTLDKKDLAEGNNANKIRAYMSARHGSKYNLSRATPLTDKKVVADFVQHMRYFTANVQSTAGEAYWAYNTATEDQKQMAGEAYELYDQLGNVFTTGTAGERITGVKDYIFASATDVTNYLGVATGGASKLITLGVNQSAKTAVKRAMIQAGKDALLKNKSKKLVAKAMNDAKIKTASTLTKQFAKSKPGKELVEEAGKNAAKFETNKIKYTAANQYKRSILTSAARRSLLATGALDGVVAVGQDATYQSTMMEAGSQTDYNEFQTAASFLLGIVAAGGQYTFQKAGRSVASKTDIKLKTKIRKSSRLLNTPLLSLNWKNAKSADEAVDKQMNESIDAWAKKWKSWETKTELKGKTRTDLHIDLLQEIVLGGDKKGGLVELYRRNTGGTRIAADVKFVDLMSLMTQYLSNANVRKIAKKIKEVDPHIDLQDLTNAKQLRTTIGDILAQDASLAGKLLNVHSQGRKALDTALTASEMAMDAQVRSLDPDAVLDFVPRTPYKKGQRVIVKNEIYTATKDHTAGTSIDFKNFEIIRTPKKLEYGINLWRRLLVSLPQTTALNLKGFSAIYTGNGVAEILAATQYSVAAMLTTGAQRQEMLRMRNIYFQTQQKKFQSFLNPYDTFDTFEAVLENNKDARKVLTESYYMGVEKSGSRFGMDPENKLFKGAEKVADTASAISGVKLQDLYTKSQFFIPELDKFLKMKHNKSLDDIIDSGEYSLIDGESLAFAIEGTQKSVFAFDYTTEANKTGLRLFAKTIENASKAPGFNFIMPFGRFFNNVIATAHQWGPSGLIQSGAIEAVRKAKKVTGGKVAPRSVLEMSSAQSDFNKALVGTGAIVGATQYQFSKSEELGTFEVEGPGGSIIDHENNYPFSLLLATGEFIKSRIVNSPDYDKENNEWTFKNVTAKMNDLKIGAHTPEARANVIKQLGIGQSITNSQFGNDLNAIIDGMLGGRLTGNGKDKTDQLIKTGALLLAGATRPFGMVNDLTGMIMGYDTAKDPRQTRGKGEVLTESSTRYVGHILRAMNEKLGSVLYGEDKAKIITEAITSKDLVTARRSGRIASSGNPFAKILGVKYKEGKTNTEALMAVLGQPDWQLDARTNQPGLDATYNKFMQPILDKQAEVLLSSKKYMRGSEREKRMHFESLLKDMRKEVRQQIEILGSVNDDAFRGKAIREFSSGKYTPSIKQEALEYMKAEGYETELRDMSTEEVMQLLKFANLIDFDIERVTEGYLATRSIK